MEKIKVIVSHGTTGGYVTQRIEGKSASSTMDEKTAVERLGRKLITERPFRVVFLGDIERGKNGGRSEWEIIPMPTEEEKTERVSAYEKKEAMSPAERQAKRKAELVAQGGQIVKAALSPRAAAILKKLSKEHGGKSQAIEWALLQHEQHNLPL